MTQYTMFTAIVPADTVTTYRAMASALHPAGDGMFMTPLYSEGSQEPTHYISTGLIDTIFTEVVTTPEMFAQAAGVSLEEAQALKDGFTHLAVGESVSDGEGNPLPPVLHNHEAIAALGLSLAPQDAGAAA